MKEQKRPDERETTASRRLHPRFHVDIQVSVTSDDAIVQAHTRDISRSGLCLISDAELAREKQIAIELVLSEPLHIGGKVVWCTKLFGQYQIGVMFVNFDEEQARNLHMFIGFLDGSINSGELFDGDEETTDKPSDPDDPFGA
jgi:hypothetical protein